MPNISDWPEKERLANEREVLGFYLTSHPLEEFSEILSSHCQGIASWPACRRGRKCNWVG